MILAAKLMMFAMAMLVLVFLAEQVEKKQGNERTLFVAALFAAASIFVAGALQ